MAKRAASREKQIPLSIEELSAADRRRLENASKRWLDRVERHRVAIVESERLTEVDLDVRINTKR